MFALVRCRVLMYLTYEQMSVVTVTLFATCVTATADCCIQQVPIRVPKRGTSRRSRKSDPCPLCAKTRACKLDHDHIVRNAPVLIFKCTGMVNKVAARLSDLVNV